MKGYGLLAIVLLFIFGGGFAGLVLGIFTKTVTGLSWPVYAVPIVVAFLAGSLAALIATGNEKAPA